MTIPTLSTRQLVALLQTAPRSLSPALDADAPVAAVVALEGAAIDLRGVGNGGRPSAGVGTVLVGVGAASDPAAPLCDVVLAEGDPSLDAILATTSAHPTAASALVSLLRGQPSRSIEDGLLIESAVYSALQAGQDHRSWRATRPVRARAAEARPAVTVERAGAVVTVTLQRPARHNAFSAAMRDGLLDALDVTLLDPDVRLVLRGAGPSFCSGGDLDEFGSATDPAAAHLVRLQASVARALAAVADRVTVHLHGACMGAGIELPAFAARVVAAPDVTIALPELRLGLIPGAGGTVSVSRRIGRQRTARLALSGQAIDGTTALAWGLVDELSG